MQARQLRAHMCMRIRLNAEYARESSRPQPFREMISVHRGSTQIPCCPLGTQSLGHCSGKRLRAPQRLTQLMGSRPDN